MMISFASQRRIMNAETHPHEPTLVRNTAALAESTPRGLVSLPRSQSLVHSTTVGQEHGKNRVASCMWFEAKPISFVDVTLELTFLMVQVHKLAATSIASLSRVFGMARRERSTRHRSQIPIPGLPLATVPANDKRGGSKRTIGCGFWSEFWEGREASMGCASPHQPR